MSYGVQEWVGFLQNCVLGSVHGNRFLLTSRKQSMRERDGGAAQSCQLRMKCRGWNVLASDVEEKTDSLQKPVISVEQVRLGRA